MSPKRQYSAPTNAAGSPLPGEPAFLAVGKLRHPHGVHGEILMEVFTDFPDRLQPDTILYLGPEVDRLKLIKCRPHREGLLMTFEGYTTPEEVGQFRNQILYVKADERPPLADGEYYHHQLLNLNVITDAGVPIGIVNEILETGASDVLVIRPAIGPDVLIPMVDIFIQNIDLANRAITVHIIPGMLTEESSS
jgi:16S rRNA processing protein RimM